jgi:hypothetical protein
MPEDGSTFTMLGNAQRPKGTYAIAGRCPSTPIYHSFYNDSCLLDATWADLPDDEDVAAFRKDPGIKPKNSNLRIPLEAGGKHGLELDCLLHHGSSRFLPAESRAPTGCRSELP